ncbi:hypothetical protein Gorai_022174, partial [Gossypium raimondii]|nr:hypothetical protein [Gossypium raimondii]
MKADFKKRYGGGKADTAIAKSLNKEFGPVMREHMKYIIEHAEEIEKLLKVKAQVSEVKSIMLENIDKAIDRGENLTTLADKTENLRDQAQAYRNQGMKIRRKMWYQNMKIKLVVLGILRSKLCCDIHRMCCFDIERIGRIVRSSVSFFISSS